MSEGAETRTRSIGATIEVIATALTHDQLWREVNDAASEGHEALARVLVQPQQAGWVHSDVSALTLAIWVRSMIFGRL